MTNKRKHLKQVKNQAQEGRSMVEMLGVLAIIGVLSIGGIAGYRMAMNHYQANQIAHEINMMRTDAKMKVAQGAKNLMLGSPYDDEKHLNFNANYGVEFGLAVFSETGEPEESGESGYFIKVSDVSAGVCKPLVTLLDGMDDAIAVVVNELENNADSSADLCIEESNEIEVDFSTQDLGVSGGGSGNPDEPEPPVTDPNSGDESQDDDPVPEECPGSTWLSADGRKCTCEDTEKTCNGGCCAGCTGGKVWNGKKCVCPAGSEPSTDGESCVCKTGTPHWNGSKCTECPNEAPWDETTKQCKCEGNKVWKESKKACVDNNGGECEDNADCGPGEYCYLYYGYSCSDNGEFQSGKFGVGKSDSYKGECRNARGDAKEGEKTGFILGKSDKNGGYMTWWSAGRFCAALGRPQATHDTIKCSLNPDERYCLDFDGNMIDDLRSDFGSGSYMWLADEYGDSCRAYAVYLDLGNVDYPGRRSLIYYALCE